MSPNSTTYTTRVAGIWNTRHIIEDSEGVIGQLVTSRNAWGMVTGARYLPQEGEVLEFRRDPGILRSQFSLWTEDGEWLAAALRWGFAQRVVNLSTGSKPMRLVPLPGFSRGWRLLAPKTGEMARITQDLVGRGCRVEVFRRMDFEVVLFAYFLGSQLLMESIWPGPEAERSAAALAGSR
ncbi:MAG: hypothetical protein ABGY71_12130 [bacterium]|jgi:hypothetical protein|nr:hypothetical protein [Planctomycetota bacterium]HIL51904.1 hypothetical protein [Planctomycetota bacterium]